MDDLLPCPFCGNSEDVGHNYDQEFPFIECGQCFATGVSSTFEHVRVKHWNTRDTKRPTQEAG